MCCIKGKVCGGLLPFFVFCGKSDENTVFKGETAIEMR
jgi:hypothetical protein